MDPRPAYLPRLPEALKPGARLGGLAGGAPAWGLAQAAREGRLALPQLVVCATPEQAATVRRELRFHLGAPDADGRTPGPRVLPLPADDVRPFDGLSPSPHVTRARLLALDALDRGEAVICVTSAQALLQRVLPAEVLAAACLRLAEGVILEPRALLGRLVDLGYLAVARVDEPGTAVRRGGVVDLWPVGLGQPVRLEYFDDEIESVFALDPETRRGAGRLDEVRVLPAKEALVDEAALTRASERTARAVDELGGGQATRRRVLQELKSGIWFPGAEDYLAALHDVVPLLSYLAGPEQLTVIEPRAVFEELAIFEQLTRNRWNTVPVEERPVVRPVDRYLPAEDVRKALSAAPWLQALASDCPDHGARDNEALRIREAELGPTVARLQGWLEDGVRVALVTDSHARAERLSALLQPHGLVPRPLERGRFASGPNAALWVGDLPRGFHAPASALAIVTTDELFGRKAPRRARPTSLKEAALGSVADLKVDDLVVHVRHGVGRFLGLKRLTVEGLPGRRGVRERLPQDMAEIEYRSGDRLLLPVTRLDQLYRYRAVGGKAPKLDRLGGQTWEKTKGKVRDRVLAMAQDLLRLHAQRAIHEGHAFEGRPPMLLQLEESFPFHETPDQAAAIEAVYEDLAKPEPMDRLVVGDVGFGKTEVALRAAMRVILDGYQVAVLCPTTVLAYQHAQTFRERLEGFPVNVALLSRFASPAEKKQIVADVRDGKVDIVIGTTSLLGRRVRFRQLGLVVIDEEHRFGVRQKEKLKALAQSWSDEPVDYLAMSATPIPRTLHFALSGVRQVSVIATPPEGRQPVSTLIGRWSEERIRQSIRAELERGGQVFYIHNRITGIDTLAQHIQKLVPEAIVDYAHGQMDETLLEQKLVDFVGRRTHVLVCTTIVESGVDIPNVNTILIDRAHELGLAQLYQLRGRVGRSNRRGYCTLLVPEETAMMAKAVRRLRVLQENTELGSGFAVARADMELRGAGSLLGDKQHGHIQAVGLETYIELLEDAVAAAKGELHRQRLDPELEIPVPQVLPGDYVEDVSQRLQEYRKLALCRTVHEVRRLVSDWEDRFGEPPPAVLNLGWAAEAKVRCRDLGIERVSWLKVRVVLAFHESTTVPPERIVALCQRDPQRFSLLGAGQGEGEAGTRLSIRFGEDEAEWPFRFLHWVFRQLEKAVAEDAGAQHRPVVVQKRSLPPRPPSLGPAPRKPQRRLVRDPKGGRGGPSGKGGKGGKGRG